MGLAVAVTGSTTYFGEALLRGFERDAGIERILALDSKPPRHSGPKTVWRKLDLLHPRAPETLTAELTAYSVKSVVHSATLARPIHRGGWAHEIEAIGTRHVLAASEAAAVGKLVVRSTTLCYGALESNPNYLMETAPLQGASQSPFIADKVEVEQQTTRFAQKHQDCVVTLLRFGPLIGPGCDTVAAAYLSRSTCPTLMGFDPLAQALHIDDAVGATTAALHRDVRGAVNVAAPGVVTLSTAIRLAGARPLPLPAPLLRRMAETMWSTRLGAFPPGLVDLLKFVSVGDLTRMTKELLFQPKLDAVGTLQAFGAVRRAQAA